MSDLEEQYETEMEDYNKSAPDMEEEEEAELEMEDYNELPADTEEKDLEEEFQELELEMEGENEPESETISDLEIPFADQLYELSQESFESSSELDDRVNEIMDKMERQYFFGKALRKLKKKALGKVFSIAKKYAKNLPAFKGIGAITQLARGDLKGALGSAAKVALSSAIPGGSIGLQVLDSLGGGSGSSATSEYASQDTEFPDSSEIDLEKWKNFVTVSELAFENLFDNFNESAVTDPVAANKLANQALQNAVSQTAAKTQVGQTGTGISKTTPYYRRAQTRTVGYTKRRKYKLRVRKGDNIVLRIKGL
ncbi:MAG TPA: hypothetical protein VLA74_09785 [Nitrososphaeraceae archaeon]|nr:hypothetical protein [Nitrososphaeraceae archaeon]